MALATNIVTRGRTYYARVAVPVDLMPQNQKLSLLLQRACRRDPGRRRRGAAAADPMVEGLEGEVRDGAG